MRQLNMFGGRIKRPFPLDGTGRRGPLTFKPRISSLVQFAEAPLNPFLPLPNQQLEAKGTRQSKISRCRIRRIRPLIRQWKLNPPLRRIPSPRKCSSLRVLRTPWPRIRIKARRKDPPQRIRLHSGLPKGKGKRQRAGVASVDRDPPRMPPPAAKAKDLMILVHLGPRSGRIGKNKSACPLCAFFFPLSLLCLQVWTYPYRAISARQENQWIGSDLI